ncbi:MAG: hypothetical protein HYY11_00765 [Candidatus Methylomirabilis oxyfera]|nr:hypothetical protein [Candidatus Methylomirabilis oxyfera]
MRQRLMFNGMLMLVVLGLGGFGLLSPTGAIGAQDGKIKGLAAGVPGGSISLAATGNPTTEFQVTFGDPAISFPVVISPATQVKIEEGTLPATLRNGDAVEVEGSITPEGKLLLDELELEDFLELEIDAIITSVPGGALTLPLAPGSPAVFVQFSLVASGTTFSMVITPETEVEGGALLLTAGTRVEFEAVLRDSEIRVIKIKSEAEDEDEHD